jgi:hypothetical protein
LLEKKASPMSMIGFPLLLIPLAVYNIIVFLMPGVSFTDPVLKLTLMSGAEWPVTLSDILLALAILLLLFEVIKGARPGAKYLTDHLLSLMVFSGAAAEFLLWPKFGSSTYFLLTLLALVDFLSGLALRARRGMPVTSRPAAVSSRRGARMSDAAVAKPQSDPAPEPPVPPAATVAESAPPDHPEPKVLQPEVLRPQAPEPKAPEPKAPEPKAPEPKAPEPKALEPKAPESEVREHEVLKAELLRPQVLKPEVLKPQVLESKVLESKALEPEVSNPEVSKPEAQPGATSNPPSPEVASPELEPDSNSPPRPEGPPR